jgi:hypothetical protein
MTYCMKCGYGIGSQGHYDCCITKTSNNARNGVSKVRYHQPYDDEVLENFPSSLDDQVHKGDDQ